MKTNRQAKPKKRRVKPVILLRDELRQLSYGIKGSTLPIIKQIEQFLKEEFSVMTSSEFLKHRARIEPYASFTRKLYGRSAVYGNPSSEQYEELAALNDEVKQLHIYKKIARFADLKKFDLELCIAIDQTEVKIHFRW
jgi:hypothetical protein